MKLVLPLLLISFLAFGQQKEEAEKLVDEGIILHDKGDYVGAIVKYDRALNLDKDNLLALSEKAYSLFALQKFEESIQSCQKAIEKHHGEAPLGITYVTYGNVLDVLNKPDKAIAIYDEGLSQYPNVYQLHFNKGITLSNIKRYDEAMLSFQQAIILNPKHPGSHNALGRLLSMKNERIPALMAFARFLILEPQSERAQENLANLKHIMKGNAEGKGNKSVTINITPDMLNVPKEGEKPKENNFASTDLLLAMTAGLDYDKANKKKTDVEQFIRKFEVVCSSLKETRKDNFGFYWDYYAPYFTEMADKSMVTTFAYIAFASSSNADVTDWLGTHHTEIDQFFDWSNNFTWTRK